MIYQHGKNIETPLVGNWAGNQIFSEFPMKYGAFRWTFSLKPIHSMEDEQMIGRHSNGFVTAIGVASNLFEYPLMVWFLGRKFVRLHRWVANMGDVLRRHKSPPKRIKQIQTSNLIPKIVVNLIFVILFLSFLGYSRFLSWNFGEIPRTFRPTPRWCSHQGPTSLCHKEKERNGDRIWGPHVMCEAPGGD